VPLAPKAFELLLFLVQNPGRLLSKEQIMQALWAGSFVEEANLTVSISLLRRILGEKDGNVRYIETVPKKGYRFIAPVREGLCPDAVVPETDPSSSPPIAQSLPIRHAQGLGHLQHRGIDALNACVGIAHYGQQRVGGQGGDGYACRALADPRQGQQESEESQAGNGLDDVDYTQHRFCPAWMTRQPDACGHTDTSCQQHRVPRQPQMLQGQLDDLRAVLRQKAGHQFTASWPRCTART